MRRIMVGVVAASVALVGCGGDGTESETVDEAAPTASAELEELAQSTLGEDDGAVIVAVFDPEGASFGVAGADIDGRPVTESTPWWTASLGKVPTAITVLRLADEGLVDLDAPLGTYVDFPTRDGLTTRHLLAHTSAVPDMEGHGACGDDGTIDTIEEKAAVETATEPGLVSSYSNTNYLLAGLLIESVTGEDPGAFIGADLFQPLGMESTYWFESQEGPTPFWDSPVEPPWSTCPLSGRTIGTDGALISSARDFDVLYRALFGGELLSDELLTEMLDLRSEVFGARYGLGLAELVHPDHPETVMYGFGGIAAYGTRAFHDPTIGRTVVVVTTTGDPTDLLWQAYDLVA